jgi:glycosyltransferase involved in cell wall biosynthesis
MFDISVVLPTYNCSQTISSAIKSVLNQTFNNFEFIIIDDGSIDKTEDIVRGFTDSRIKYIKKQHTGLSDTLNYGLEIARSEIIMRMDADDICLPYRFQKQYSVFLETDYDIISSWYAVFDEKKIKYIVKTSEGSTDIIKRLALHSEICHPALMAKKDKLMKMGGFFTDVEVDAFQDYELWLRLKNKVTFYNIQKVLLLYRYRKNSLSRENLKKKYKLLYEIQRPYYNLNLLSEFNISPKEEIKYRFMREYFYGSKKELRRIAASNKHLLLNVKCVIILAITLSPERFVLFFKEKRVKFNLSYMFNYFSNDNKHLRLFLKKFVNEKNTYPIC